MISDADGSRPRRLSPGRVAGAAVAVLAAAAVIGGALLLWPTAVPDGISLSADEARTRQGVVRIEAPPESCWIARLNEAERRGCGSTEIDVEIRDAIEGTVAAADPGAPITSHSLTVDGKEVRWIGGSGGFNYEVDTPAEVFPAELVEEAEDFERVLYALWLLSQTALLVTLVLYARRGAAFTRESAAGPIGTGMLLGMLGLAIVWLVNLPFRAVAHWWARRHDLTDVDYFTWLVDDWALLGAQFFSVCLALVIVMGLARRLGDNWWLPGAAVFVSIAALFTFAAPYLDFTTEPLRDPILLEAADRYETALGLPNVPARVESVSEDSDLANAYAYGIGPSRRVVFWDTLLEEPFDSDEQKVVLAHELAHHSQRHLPEGIGWFAIFAVPGAFILMLATKRRGGMGTPEAVPLALLVTVVFQLVTAPAANLISRRMESEADWKALEVTRDPYALEGVMRAFAETSLGDPSPPGWVQLVTGTHPSLEDRVAMARAWATRNAP